MSYTPTNWQTGDTVTAERLNKMEGGIQTAVDPFIVTLTPTAQDMSGVMDKTAIEIRAAFDAGKRIIFQFAGGLMWVNPTSFNPYEMDGKLVISVYAIFPYYSNSTDLLVQIQTSVGEAIYVTKIFPLTPMS